MSNVPESKNDPRLVEAIKRWFKAGKDGVVTADGEVSENRYIFTDRRVQSVLALALVAGGYFYWTHETLRLPTMDEASAMEEICPQAEAVVESGNGFQLKHPEIPFIRACKLFEDQRLVRADFWQIYKAQRQDARNAILEASRQKIEKAKATADAELAANQAQLTEQRSVARIAADAKLAEEQRKLAELQEFNKPENVLRRKEIADLEVTNLNAEAARVKAADEAAQRVERAKDKAEAARDKAAQRKADIAKRKAEEAARHAAPPLPSSASAAPIAGPVGHIDHAQDANWTAAFQYAMRASAEQNGSALLVKDCEYRPEDHGYQTCYTAISYINKQNSRTLLIARRNMQEVDILRVACHFNQAGTVRTCTDFDNSDKSVQSLNANGDWS
jgi:hypothetical protein